MSQPADTSRVVCANCMSGDEILQEWLQENGRKQKCHFCVEENSPALPVGDVAKHVLVLLGVAGYEPCPIGHSEWHGYSVENNIYTQTHNVLAEVLDYFGDPGGISSGNDLIAHLCRAMNTQILSDNPDNKTWKEPSTNTHGQDFLYSWNDFVGEITYRRRFLFLSPNMLNESSLGPKYPPEKILKIVGNALSSTGLISEMQAGVKIYRARVAVNGGAFSKKEQLGAPLRKLAKTGRMNPPGIPYFYAADKLLTACAEVCVGTPEMLKTVYIGTWSTIGTLKFIDLSTLGKLPSFFDPKKRDNHAAHKFLRKFINDVCCSLPEDDVAQLTYIPSQVVSEYFRTALSEKVDGVIFTSTQDNNGKCIVVFPGDDSNDLNSASAFDDKLKYCGYEKKLVGIEPDLVIPRISVGSMDESSCLWNISVK